MGKHYVTITSKNQITIPTSYVKELRLDRNRILNAELKEGKIILNPAPTFEDVMKKFWSKHNAKQAVTDEEIKTAARTIRISF